MRRLTWPALDVLFEGQDIRRQKEIVGHRLTAMKVHNTGYQEPVTADQLIFLPAVDGWPAHEDGQMVDTKAARAQQSFLERLAARGLTPVDNP